MHLKILSSVVVHYWPICMIESDFINLYLLSIINGSRMKIKSSIRDNRVSLISRLVVCKIALVCVSVRRLELELARLDS